MTKEFYIVRHGVTEKPGVLLGQCDVGLSALGRSQASELAKQLASEKVERVVSSRLRRAMETAAAIAEPLGLRVEHEAGLNEITYGPWDGLTWEEISQIDPETARRKTQDWWSATPAGGESPAEFLRRVSAAWTSLTAHPARATVVVAHQGVNAVLMELACRPGSNENESWEPDWLSISNFQQEPGTFRKVTVELRAGT